MRRSAPLRELSRQHHAALVLALQAERAAASGAAADVAAMANRLVEKYRSELVSHFAEEERELLPLLARHGRTRLVERTLAEHAQFDALVARLDAGPDTAVLREAAALLTAHVRFEEQELFEVLEALLAADH